VPEESPPAHVPDGRVSTGNPGLDAMLEGGLVAHRPYLVVGPAGTGKSRLALQFLCEGTRKGERVLLVTLEEPPNEARVNHRGLAPELDSVFVFDAIPDIMRYERTPFKDIASVRSAVPFRNVSFDIRRTPELSSVEVTITALEQMLRSEVQHRNYTRVVIDSLTALQYFCMKGFDPVAGAQTFLRFLSDLQVTTILTVESPLEDADTPERMLARGEIRLFRWELDDQTVRAIGVEKFRGSPHDVRLHPYRIGPKGLDINLRVTISRDTRKIIEPVAPSLPAEPAPITMEPMAETVEDLILVGADLGGLRTEVEAALAATTKGDLEGTELHLANARAHTVDFAETLRKRVDGVASLTPAAADARRRILERADTVRVGVPPGRLPTPPTLAAELSRILTLIPPPPTAPLAAIPGATPTPVVAPPVVALTPTSIEQPITLPVGTPVAPPAVVESARSEPSPEAISVAAAPPVPSGPSPAPEVEPEPATVEAVSARPVEVEAPRPEAANPEKTTSRTPEPPPSTPREAIPSVAEYLAPHSHLHPEPPPLPTTRPAAKSGSIPHVATPGPVASGKTTATGRTGPLASAGHAPPGPPLKAGSAVHPAPTRHPDLPTPTATPITPPGPESPTEAPASKRRRKTAAVPKKRTPVGRAALEPKTEVGPAMAPVADSPPATPPAPALPASPGPIPDAATAGSGGDAEPSPGSAAKSKRRPVRKKKAPPVVSATPGAAPSGEANSPPPPAATDPPPPKPEDVPGSSNAPKEGG
jgi:KaiC/GvpD/RAD55 family RecA-like ATPase